MSVTVNILAGHRGGKMEVICTLYLATRLSYHIKSNIVTRETCMSMMRAASPSPKLSKLQTRYAL